MNKLYKILVGLFIAVWALHGAQTIARSRQKSGSKQPPVECRLLADDFDLVRLQQEFEGIKNAIIPRSKYTDLWNGIPLKNALGATDAKGLQIYVTIKRDHMLKSYPTEYLDRVPYIKEVIELIEETFNVETGLIRIFKLPAGKKISRHKDGVIFNAHSGKVSRLHIPIITTPDVQFVVNDKVFYLEPGKLYFTDVSLPHFVINTGKTDRIHLIIDVHTNEHIRKYILESEEPPSVPYTKKR